MLFRNLPSAVASNRPLLKCTCGHGWEASTAGTVGGAVGGAGCAVRGAVAVAALLVAGSVVWLVTWTMALSVAPVCCTKTHGGHSSPALLCHAFALYTLATHPKGSKPSDY